MPHPELSARRVLAASGLATMAICTPQLAMTLVPPPPAAVAQADCPNGESADTFTEACVPDLVPNTSGLTAAPNQLPQINGIPCTGANSGQCIGLSEDAQAAGPHAVPRSSFSASP